MNELRIFKNEDFGTVRGMEINGEGWLVGKDVAGRLGYTNPQKAIRDHVDGEDRTVNESFTVNGTQGVLINESGFYSLVLSSKLPTAKKFKRWVTSEVLPAIRKHGVYATDNMIEEMLDNPDAMIQALTKLKEERERSRALEAKIEQDAPKVAFADALSVSKTSIPVGDFAKIIQQNGVDMGRNRFFLWLRDNDYLIKSGASYNLPTQKAMRLDLFEVLEKPAVVDEETIIKRYVRITTKGQKYFTNVLLRETHE